MTTWLALFILALSGMFLVSNDSGMIAGIDATTFGYAAFLLALLVYVSGALVGRYVGGGGAMFRDAVTWLALGLGLVTVYAYKNELTPIATRVVGELLPGTAMTVETSAGGPHRGQDQEAAERPLHGKGPDQRQHGLHDCGYGRHIHCFDPERCEKGRHRRR